MLGLASSAKRKSSLGLVLLLAFILMAFLVTPAPLANARHTTSTTTSTTTTTTSAFNTFIRTYGNVISKTTQQKDVFPEDLQATSDGGYIFLASTNCTTQACVSAQGGANPIVEWLVKTDSSGNAQWQKEVGCFSSPPGDYSIGLALQQTTDGGYIVGGGAIDCGSGTTCGGLFSLTCAIVEKLDSGGNLNWAQVYSVSPNGGDITGIRQTADGGYVAVGNSYAPGDAENGALILKLDGSGNVQWQRVLGPAGSTIASFNAVQQTSDGGYVATGNFLTPTSGIAPQSVLVVKFDSNGNVQWQHGYNYGTSNSVIQTSDSGFLLAGSTPAGVPTGYPGSSYLLLKLDSSGKIQWQKAFNGGQYCYFNGYSETCVTLGGVIYSAHQTSDGSYVVAGDGDLKLTDSTPLVPWLAKVDSNGNLLWQYFYYQTSSAGRPLSEYFASSALAKDGGFMVLGITEDYALGLHLLYAVKTDSSGLCSRTCSEVHTATPLSALNPALAISSPSLPVSTTTTPGLGSPIQTRTTSITVKQDC